MGAEMLSLLLLTMAPDVAASTPTDAVVSQLENQREWSEPDRLRAVDLAKLKGAAWGSCLELTEQHFRRSKESVETVATAIFGGCLIQERAYQRAYAVALRGLASPMERTEQARQGVETTRASKREEIISRLVNDRLPPAKPRLAQ